MASKGKEEVEEREVRYFVSIESILSMMNYEFSDANNTDLVTSRIDLPCSTNNYVYTQGTTYEKVLEVCKKQYMEKHHYKEPKMFVGTVRDEISCFTFERYIEDVYPEDQYSRDADEYLDWSLTEDTEEVWDRY